MKLLNKTQNSLLTENMQEANTIFKKIKGLLGRKSIGEDECLLIPGAKQIHCFFMRFPIDIVFLDKNKKIIKIYKNFKPYRMTSFIFFAKHVLEFKVGFCESKNTKLGDALEW
ncbi:DUF192 domain-containing protein [bacterium]